MREHQFLAATGNVDYTFERVRGLATMLFGQSGFFIDRFRGHTGDGIALAARLRQCVREGARAPARQIDIEPGGWLYKDPACGWTP